jgi:hypothetical protein
MSIETSIKLLDGGSVSLLFKRHQANLISVSKEAKRKCEYSGKCKRIGYKENGFT